MSSHPVLAVHDLEGEAAWYTEVLGCENMEVDAGNWIFCAAGGVEFRLGRCLDAPLASEIGDHSYVAYLVVDDVDAFFERAKRAGAAVRKEPTDEPWGMREMAVASPEGHRFMVGQDIGQAAEP